MKKRIMLSAVVGFSWSVILAQPSLSFNAHHLKSGEDNSMSYCEYVQPGQAGEAIVWDFSGLSFVKSFTGQVNDASATDFGVDFPGTTTHLQEFDSHFFFNVRDNRIEQYGYTSGDGRIQTRYDIPFVKMKFPFSYGENFSGNFSGASYYLGEERARVSGDYLIEADAWGQLILPGNVSYDNTLRIRTEKAYISESGNRQEEVRITTYRWYNEAHRYPLLVLTSYTVSNGEKSAVSYQAAYNNNAVKNIAPLALESIQLYPNPTSDHLVLEYDVIAAGTVHFSIIDYSGRILRQFSQEVKFAGSQQKYLDQHIRGLKPSTYILRIQNGEALIERNITIQH
ncbi:MAG: T9SS type A sorting domain-containing protein [Bacteroidales bacterium]|nr:T9SS type A sorting domain-containing protein [Bacteroidales bacterium]